MTVGIAVRLPGIGAVIGTDSRITLEDGLISSDHEDKTLLTKDYVACFAGSWGGLLVELRNNPPKSREELRKALIDLDAKDSHDRDYEALVYDRKGDFVWHCDHQGDSARITTYTAIGCGGAIALGVLDASGAPKTLEAAEKLVRKALKITIRRHAFCGGRLRVLMVPKKGQILIQ